MDALKNYNDSDMDLDENSEQISKKKSGDQVGKPHGCHPLFITYVHRCVLNKEHLHKAFVELRGFCFLRS